MSMINEPVEVMRGRHGQDPLFGPLPGARRGAVLAYDFELPASFDPWPGRTLIERTFVLLDLGVSFANPCWIRHMRPDGTVVNRDAEGRDTWYVDLITIEQDGNRYTCRDLYIDVMVPMDGRHYRMLDLDEFADAVEHGSLSIEQAVDALRRWQRSSTDTFTRTAHRPAGWTDFPPTAILPLLEMPPLGDPIRWNG
jgi:hypothetical protein